MGSIWDPEGPFYEPPPICADNPIGLPCGALTVQLYLRRPLRSNLPGGGPTRPP
jgi:hypothetical protein